MIKRVIFIRSGETDWNSNSRWQGFVAVPLNEHGKKQATALAKFIRHIGISAIYASDLKRALDTVAPIAAEVGFEPIIDARLRERSVGVWQGLTIDEIRAWYPEEYAALQEERDHYRIPGGESRFDVRERMVDIFHHIVEQAHGESVAIVSHTTAILTLLNELIPSYDQSATPLDNTSVTTLLHHENGTWELVAADDTLHLEGLRSDSIGDEL